MFKRLGDAPLLPTFAEKALQTLEDFERHDRLMIAGSEPRAIVWFVAWSGTHREVQAERFGEYLPSLMSAAHRFVDAGAPLAGILQIDAYLRGTPEDAEVDVEFSFLPGLLLGCPDDGPEALPAVLQINPGLYTPEELQQLRRAAG